MCLTTGEILPKQEYLVEQLLAWSVQVAPKNINCWKKFEPRGASFITPFRNYRWPEPGKVVSVKQFGVSLKHRTINMLNVSEGLHAYTTKAMALMRCRTSSTAVIKRMIIPAGTQYIISGDGTEIVALAMKMAPTKTRMKKDAGRKRAGTNPGKKRMAKRKK